MITEKINDKPVSSYFYLIPDGVPKGPNSLTDIKELVEKGSIPADTKIALSGSDDWRVISEIV
jgi:hypothetical protein